MQQARCCQGKQFRCVMMEKELRKVKDFKRREEGILQTALDLFLEKGEEKVTVEMIAERVGIGKGTIYKHFHSKSEIFLRLMLDYEQELSDLLASDVVEEDKSALFRHYFDFRLKNAKKYLLFDRLEELLIKNGTLPEMMLKLHELRKVNIERMKEVVLGNINEGYLEEVPEHYHVGLAWALIHGAAALHEAKFSRQLIADRVDFFQFLMDVGTRAGNKGQRKTQYMQTAVKEYAQESEVAEPSDLEASAEAALDETIEAPAY